VTRVVPRTAECKSKSKNQRANIQSKNQKLLVSPMRSIARIFYICFLIFDFLLGHLWAAGSANIPQKQGN